MKSKWSPYEVKMSSLKAFEGVFETNKHVSGGQSAAEARGQRPDFVVRLLSREQ